MATDQSLIIRPLVPGDLDFAGHLVTQAGWNQTRDDWNNLINCPHGACFLAVCDGAPAGSVSVLVHGGTLAWIGMLLVEESFRNRGIGKALLEKAMEVARTRGASCLGLDATPAGKPLYEKLGFVIGSELKRWEGIAPHISDEESLPSFETMHASGLDRLDRFAFGLDRSEWLRTLAKISASAVIVHGDEVRAYGFLRPGRKAFYLGPVVATDTVSARRVVRSLLCGVEGKKVYWDSFSIGALYSPSEEGFIPQRPFHRMLLGAGPAWIESRQVAITDPATA